jgi:hypothetical protein
MNINFWGNAINKAAGDADFCIQPPMDSEVEYDSNVRFIDPSKKPSWSAVQAQMDPVEWKTVRFKRDKKLQACDWTVLPDVPMDASKRTEWETYRQELRDVTDQSDPFNITWPTPPE